MTTITALLLMCAVVWSAQLSAAGAVSNVDIHVRTVGARGQVLALDELSWWREESAHAKALERCRARRCDTWALREMGAADGGAATASSGRNGVRIYFSAARAEENDASCWELFVGEIAIVREHVWLEARAVRRFAVKPRSAGTVCK
jgi:hypothetical protein